MANKTYCFDLDGTLCTNTEGSYENAMPFANRISVVNRLYEEGNSIVIDTARGSTTGIDWFSLTESQLKEWGVKYNELRVGQKPFAHHYIDDKGINDQDFFAIHNLKNLK